ncbi:hypothetical protein OEZ85_011341 [Tetradesmus obliquus]|uniref:Pentacotripeptide-repeat region of PRORP domain-containing protein n=1 Tax=Tetradesmus obliquus TaxID=3088 RepID=A0ABY8TQ27_TETOB|nr:hypothetical protein OEZ85_011341 [Tetradesmus obliquus]
MLSQLPEASRYTVQQNNSFGGSQFLRPSKLACSSSSTAVAQQRRSSHVADYAKGVGALVSANRIPEAVSLLERSLDKQRKLHALSTGDLLEALCEQGRHETAWQLIRRLSASSNRLPLKVLHRLLKTAGQFGSVDDVLAVYQHQQQLYGFASMGVQTTLIHALLKAHGRGQPGTLLAYEAWGRLRRSGRQLDAQALLAGAADDGSAAGWQGCCLRAAAAAAAGGQARGMGMHACVCVGRLQEAEALLEHLRSVAGAASRPVVSGHNLLMKAAAAAGNCDAARKQFAGMKARGLAPDAVSYNTLLAAFVAAGELLRARAVLDKMVREGVAPDVWSYTGLLLGLGRAGQLQEAQGVLGDMTGAGLRPTEVRGVCCRGSF